MLALDLIYLYSTFQELGLFGNCIEYLNISLGNIAKQSAVNFLDFSSAKTHTIYVSNMALFQGQMSTFLKLVVKEGRISFTAAVERKSSRLDRCLIKKSIMYRTEELMEKTQFEVENQMD